MDDIKELIPDKLKEGLTPAEERLLKASLEGEVVDFRVGDEDADKPENAEKWGAERTLRSEFLYWLCIDTATVKNIHFKGVQTKGVKVLGIMDFQFAKIRHPLMIADSAMKEIVLIGASIKTLNLSGSVIASLVADGLTTEWHLLLRGTTVIGQTRLPGAVIGADLSCNVAKFGNTDNIAFLADSINVKRNAFFNQMITMGEFRCPGAFISGSMECNDAKVENAKPDGDAFMADALIIRGNLLLRNFEARGKVRFVGANIGATFECNNSIFDNSAGGSFIADRISTNGNLVLDNVSSKGMVSLHSANINGDLSCIGSNFENPDGYAFVGEKLNVKGVLHINKMKHSGIINLGHAQVSELVDDIASWPNAGMLVLDGFKCHALAGDKTPRSAAERLEWLRLQPKEPFHPQPYEQLAKVFREMGHESDAREVLIAKQEDLRKYGKLSKPAKVWNWFLGRTIGHGYKPRRAIIISTILVTIGTGIFCNADNASVMQPSKERVYLDENFLKTQHLPSRYPRFSPLVYSFDVFVPFLDLHQEDYWLPDASRPYGALYRLYLWFHIILGWVFSTLAALSLTGLIRKE